ncbi:unnamed protein product [Rotaria magnacalcarata]|uniref:FLYWCH-type domain-containing protein n=1 Tax=Rotaria magnacalcarata TaxID=392030 RepID=A0A820QTQ3_9BILA|nr:unnamed protein product [Rotaria magnacalcarata]CAF4091891.1 unnamed protein product [Rotaria magnacalcarata]CAF4123642.1 unnamed protein product [Rotaria magnacalcarata]CAF4154697.1 unnamed protein product [Rotaria magnacalcarata]CAF4428100.1 unnamed protein product [Rotaria magnacalcarata]
MLAINGYNFQFKNFNNKGTNKFWRCANRSCGVLLHTSLNEEFLRYSGKVIEHNHLPNPAEVEIRNLRETMRQRAENELSPLQEIAEQEMRKTLLTAEALAVLPGASTIVMPKAPVVSSFVIPDLYTKDYLNNDRLLLHDSDDTKFQNNESGSVRSQ